MVSARVCCGIVVALVALVACTVAKAGDSDVLVLTEQNFDDMIKEHSHILVGKSFLSAIFFLIPNNNFHFDLSVS